MTFLSEKREWYCSPFSNITDKSEMNVLKVCRQLNNLLNKYKRQNDYTLKNT